MFKELTRRFWLPTPRKIRKLGYAILAGCTLISSGGLFMMEQLQAIFTQFELKIIIGIVMILGFISKVITSLFVEEEKQNE